MWHSCPTEYYSATKRKELINTTLTNLENIMLSSQTRKVMCCIVLFIPNTQNRQNQGDRKQTSGCQELGKRKNGERLLNRNRVSIWGDEKFWEETEVLVI